MITMPETLVDAAQAAGMLVPVNLRDYDKDIYPYWHIYCVIQLDRPMSSPDSHILNANTVAKLSDNVVRSIKPADVDGII